MLFFLIFLLLSLLAVVTLCLIIIKGSIYLFATLLNKAPNKTTQQLKKLIIGGGMVLVLNFGIMAITQVNAYTPLINDANGNLVEGSISELRSLKLNGRKQWISIRGWDTNKPVLLFLAGGPGGTQMAAVRHELGELEKHFIVVNWDQPGSGKSFRAIKNTKITLNTYLEDGYALTEYLKMRFKQDKIYLIGESWGSALGIFLVAKYPESYHAFIGTGQMVDFLETERIDYAKALELATQNGNQKIVKKLIANGEPPYYGKEVTWKSAVYLNYLNQHMASNPEVFNAGYNTLRDVFSPEYGILDKIYFFLGIIKTFNNVYQQLYDIDLRTAYPKLDIPIYFFIGRHDLNAPTVLVEEYYELLDAPSKKLVWFEHSAHSPWINENEKFIMEVISCFLD